MTKRAILWCGQLRAPELARDAEGRLHEVGDPLLVTDDFRIQVNGLELAFRAAQALGVPAEEIHACLLRDELAPQHLQTPPYKATVADLRRLVDLLAVRSEPADALLFVAVNHGVRQGYLATADPVDAYGDRDPNAPRLTPQMLDECLRPLAGPQVLIIATCYAGVFLPLAQGRRAVVATCSATERYLVSRADGSCSAFLDELFGAWCGVTHSDGVPATRLPLDQAFARARERLALPPSLNIPHLEGTNVWPP
jgi:hypothetical protein